jgi:hypothetical protein
MGTSIHLSGEDIVVALGELAPVLRAGGLLEVGVWGAEASRIRLDHHGRHFRHRTDDQMKELLASTGDVDAFATWDHLPTGWHYQWARVTVGASNMRSFAAAAAAAVRGCGCGGGGGGLSSED